MNRPKVLHVGGVLYWVMRIRNPDTQVLKDADSTPTVAIRKNNASTGDSVTVTKRSATTGIYDCSYNPAGEVEGDEFTVEETATVTGTTTVQATYSTGWEFTVIAVERGTDGANTTAPANSTIADISSRLPASLEGGRIAAVLDSASITAVQSGLATSASITALRGADNDTLKTLSDQIDGISSGGTDWTANERTAIRSILGVPASGTTPADPTVGILDTIRDSVGTYIAGISAVASTTTGTIVGFPSSLNLGDSYTDEADAAIHVFIRDASDDPITAVGSFNFTDPEFAPEVNITQSGSTGRVKAVVTFVEASPEDYLKVEIPSSQSRRASPGTATVQCLLKWVDTDGKVLCQKTLSKQAVTWNEMV